MADVVNPFAAGQQCRRWLGRGGFYLEVVDTNNSFLTHFGRYGNQDSGPGGRTQTPAIPPAWPTYVAVGENHAYVNDTIGMVSLQTRSCAPMIPQQ